jgi:hypothetical protein
VSPILFNLYNEYITKEALEWFGDFNLGQVIRTVKYAVDAVLVAKGATVDRLSEIGRCYGLEKNVEKLS